MELFNTYHEMKGNEIDLYILHSFSSYLLIFQLFFTEFVPVQICVL